MIGFQKILFQFHPESVLLRFFIYTIFLILALLGFKPVFINAK